LLARSLQETLIAAPLPNNGGQDLQTMTKHFLDCLP